MIVIARNKGGAYILSEVDGSVSKLPFAAFRVIPYFSHTHIDSYTDNLDIDGDELTTMITSLRTKSTPVDL